MNEYNVCIFTRIIIVDWIGDTHDAMNVAMAMEDYSQDLSQELKTVSTQNKILKKDRQTTAHVLSTKLKMNKVNIS